MSAIELIKSIRFKTGLPLKDINKAIALLKSEDEEEIITHLRSQGLLKAQARKDKETNNGGVYSYVHDNRLGVLLEVKCETDFVSRSDLFKDFCNDVCLHIAAYQPRFIDESEVNGDFIEAELDIFKTQLVNEGKPENIIEKILEGKKSKITKEFSLLSQPYIKDSNISVSDYLSQVSQTTGEKISISRFIIYSLNS
ncbi:MAG: elongation factor Ts [Patescibacteria group bacterium]